MVEGDRTISQLVGMTKAHTMRRCGVSYDQAMPLNLVTRPLSYAIALTLTNHKIMLNFDGAIPCDEMTSNAYFQEPYMKFLGGC